jgi:hypothetical protein
MATTTSTPSATATATAATITVTTRKTRIHDSSNTTCPKVQLNSCADLKDYGLLDMPECTCQDRHGGGGTFVCRDGDYVFCQGVFLIKNLGGEEPLSNDVVGGGGGSTSSTSSSSKNSGSSNNSNNNLVGSSGTSSATMNEPKQADRLSRTTAMTTATLGIAGIVLVMVLVYFVSGRTQRRRRRLLMPPIFSEYRDHNTNEEDGIEHGIQRQTEADQEETGTQVELGSMA